MLRSTVAGITLTTDSLNRNGIAASSSRSTSSLDSVSSSLNSQAEHVTSPFSIVETPLADGVYGTYQACDAMCDAVLGRIPPDYSGMNDPWVIDLAERITQGARTGREEVERIWRFACQIPYEVHPPSIQIVKDARRVVESGESDCVGLTVLICTLAMARGFDCRFCVQYWDNEQLFSHILPEVFVDGYWLACDAVARNLPIDSLQKLPDEGFNLTWEIN